MSISNEIGIERRGFDPHWLAVEGALRPYVRTFMAVEASAPAPVRLDLAAHESLMLTVRLGRADERGQRSGEHGHDARLTVIRQWTGWFCAVGACVGLFALLTPLGSVCLFDGRTRAHAQRIGTPLAALLDAQLTRALECEIARAATMAERLCRFASWLESRAATCSGFTPAAQRAGRAALRLCEQPSLPTERLAADECVSRRQLERDFAQWLGSSPRRLARVARVQAVSRKSAAGASLADIAADVGFADQSHMSRVVRRLTGLTPRGFVRSRHALNAHALRIAAVA